MKKLKIAFIDIIGLKYDGRTVYNRGLGGSESAIIFMAEELVKLGFDVTVFNNCIGDDSSPGLFNGVNYVDLSTVGHYNDEKYDVVIGSRTVVAFEEGSQFSNIMKNARLKVLWMHDTFCGGDHLVESLTKSGRIDQIFTLSDFHTNYVTTSHHGPKRNFEVLKPHIFQTRNGIRRYHDSVDMDKKDPNLFVYNASVSKGMKPLLARIWPEYLKINPNAKLVIIGGYYIWDPAKEDMYEKEFKELATQQYKNVTFTGIISQKQIADILVKAKYFIYPGAFPETFGISTLEALNYNVVMLTTRFGALEETAIDAASYKIDYAIEPNSLYPHINLDRQCEAFLAMVNHAVSNTYLTYQKQNACNIVKDVSTWDTVALQWKQQFFYTLKEILPVDEYRKVTKINNRVREVFNRTYINPVERMPTKTKAEQFITIITPFYNAASWIEKCVLSVAQQDYSNYRMFLINDASTDNTEEVLLRLLASFPAELRAKFHYTKNPKNVGAVANHWSTLTLKDYDRNEIIMLLDGDDWLTSNNGIFNYYNDIYDENIEFTYGSCWSHVDNIPLIAQEYPKHVQENRLYREHKFPWNMPYTHLRTFRYSLFNNGVNKSMLVDEKGMFYKAGGDGALFYALLEAARPESIKCIQDIFYVYNDAHPNNDYKINGAEQTKNANRILSSKHEMKEEKRMKRILIAIPTAKYIEPETFRSIYNLQIPEGYEAQFQYFYGYNIEQIRNLIADWVIKGFDYLFAVDSDIAFPEFTLKKFLEADVPYISGVYIQRKPDQCIVELYEETPKGTTNIPWERVQNRGIIEVAGSGFGCVLIKKEVFAAIGYPQFVYKTAIDHKDSYSEDVYFCTQARKLGFKLYADTSIVCDHIGNATYRPVAIQQEPQKPQKPNDEDFLRNLKDTIKIPAAHSSYLDYMKQIGIHPKLIFDVGACVLHWTKEAEKVWPNAEIVAFEAMPQCEFLYKEKGMKYNIGVLSDTEKEVDFYMNVHAPGGNSYYRENPELSSMANEYYPVGSATKVMTQRLDTVMLKKGLKIPDLLKIDVQGAELDILKGLGANIYYIKDIILELQEVNYNMGAPKKDEVVKWLETRGFRLVTNMPFSDNGADGDYHFKNTRWD